MSTNERGRIYFFRTQTGKGSNFGALQEINSNFDMLKSVQISSGRAMGWTSNDDLLEWIFDKRQSSKKNEFVFLLHKPTYQFTKIKFKTVLLNKSMCAGLDTFGNVLVWGKSSSGLLGLGFDINALDVPTIWEGLREITELSWSENHAVALTSLGDAYSWGTGKYGELGLEKMIYSPVPQKVTNLNDKIYTKVFCGNWITCLWDNTGAFSYYGVIIKAWKGNYSSVTTKNLLNDESTFNNWDLFSEKVIVEWENENFEQIAIGNGFIGMLSKKGSVFVLEYSDKLTMLYCKYFVYSISIAHNEIYGWGSDKNTMNSTGNLVNTGSSPSKHADSKVWTSNNIKTAPTYYLIKWTSKFLDNEVSSEIWSTTFYRISEEVNIRNILLLNSNGNRNILWWLDKESGSGLNNSFLSPINRRTLDVNDVSLDNITYSDIQGSTLKKGQSVDSFLIFDSEYDDSFNINIKRSKSNNNNFNNSFCLNQNNVMQRGASRSLSPYWNKTMTLNNNTTRLIGGNGSYGRFCSSVGMNNYYGNGPGNQIPNSNHIRTNTANISCILGKSTSDFIIGNTNMGGKTKDRDKNIISPVTSNNINSNNNRQLYEDESIDMKDKEWKNCSQEIDSIINSFKLKQKEQKINLQNKYSSTNAHSHRNIFKDSSSHSNTASNQGTMNNMMTSNDIWKQKHNRVQSTDWNLSFSTDIKRSLMSNTTPNNKLTDLKNKAAKDNKGKLIHIEKSATVNNGLLYGHWDMSNVNIETKNEIVSDLEGLLNKTNNDNSNNNIELKNELYSDIEDFNKTNNSNLIFNDDISNIRSGYRNNSNTNSAVINKRYVSGGEITGNINKNLSKINAWNNTNTHGNDDDIILLSNNSLSNNYGTNMQSKRCKTDADENTKISNGSIMLGKGNLNTNVNINRSFNHFTTSKASCKGSSRNRKSWNEIDEERTKVMNNINSLSSAEKFRRVIYKSYGFDIVDDNNSTIKKQALISQARKKFATEKILEKDEYLNKLQEKNEEYMENNVSKKESVPSSHYHKEGTVAFKHIFNTKFSQYSLHSWSNKNKNNEDSLMFEETPKFKSRLVRSSKWSDNENKIIKGFTDWYKLSEGDNSNSWSLNNSRREKGRKQLNKRQNDCNDYITLNTNSKQYYRHNSNSYCDNRNGLDLKEDKNKIGKNNKYNENQRNSQDSKNMSSHRNNSESNCSNSEDKMRQRANSGSHKSSGRNSKHIGKKSKESGGKNKNRDRNQVEQYIPIVNSKENNISSDEGGEGNLYRKQGLGQEQMIGKNKEDYYTSNQSQVKHVKQSHSNDNDIKMNKIPILRLKDRNEDNSNNNSQSNNVNSITSSIFKKRSSLNKSNQSEESSINGNKEQGNASNTMNEKNSTLLRQKLYEDAQNDEKRRNNVSNSKNKSSERSKESSLVNSKDNHDSDSSEGKEIWNSPTFKQMKNSNGQNFFEIDASDGIDANLGRGQSMEVNANKIFENRNDQDKRTNLNRDSRDDFGRAISGNRETDEGRDYERQYKNEKQNDSSVKIKGNNNSYNNSKASGKYENAEVNSRINKMSREGKMYWSDSGSDHDSNDNRNSNINSKNKKDMNSKNTTDTIYETPNKWNVLHKTKDNRNNVNNNNTGNTRWNNHDHSNEDNVYNRNEGYYNEGNDQYQEQEQDNENENENISNTPNNKTNLLTSSTNNQIEPTQSLNMNTQSTESDWMFSFDPNKMQKKWMKNNRLTEQLHKNGEISANKKSSNNPLNIEVDWSNNIIQEEEQYSSHINTGNSKETKNNNADNNTNEIKKHKKQLKIKKGYSSEENIEENDISNHNQEERKLRTGKMNQETFKRTRGKYKGYEDENADSRSNRDENDQEDQKENENQNDKYINSKGMHQRMDNQTYHQGETYQQDRKRHNANNSNKHGNSRKKNEQNEHEGSYSYSSSTDNKNHESPKTKNQELIYANRSKGGEVLTQGKKSNNVNKTSSQSESDSNKNSNQRRGNAASNNQSQTHNQAQTHGSSSQMKGQNWTKNNNNNNYQSDESHNWKNSNNIIYQNKASLFSTTSTTNKPPLPQKKKKDSDKNINIPLDKESYLKRKQKNEFQTLESNDSSNNVSSTIKQIRPPSITNPPSQFGNSDWDAENYLEESENQTYSNKAHQSNKGTNQKSDLKSYSSRLSSNNNFSLNDGNNAYGNDDRTKRISSSPIKSDVINPEDTFGISESGQNTEREKNSLHISPKSKNKKTENQTAKALNTSDKRIKSPLSIKIPFDESNNDDGVERNNKQGELDQEKKQAMNMAMSSSKGNNENENRSSNNMTSGANQNLSPNTNTNEQKIFTLKDEENPTDISPKDNSINGNTKKTKGKSGSPSENYNNNNMHNINNSNNSNSQCNLTKPQSKLQQYKAKNQKEKSSHNYKSNNSGNNQMYKPVKHNHGNNSLYNSNNIVNTTNSNKTVTEPNESDGKSLKSAKRTTNKPNRNPNPQKKFQRKLKSSR